MKFMEINNEIFEEKVSLLTGWYIIIINSKLQFQYFLEDFYFGFTIMYLFILAYTYILYFTF